MTKGDTGLIPDQDPGLPPVPVQDPGVLHLGRGTIRVPSMVPGRLAPGTISGRGRGTRAMDPPPRNLSLINPNCVQTLHVRLQFNIIKSKFL